MNTSYRKHRRNQKTNNLHLSAKRVNRSRLWRKIHARKALEATIHSSPATEVHSSTTHSDQAGESNVPIVQSNTRPETAQEPVRILQGEDKKDILVENLQDNQIEDAAPGSDIHNEPSCSTTPTTSQPAQNKSGVEELAVEANDSSVADLKMESAEDDEDSLHDFDMETDGKLDAHRLQEKTIEGRRIVNLQHMFTDFITKFGNHSRGIDCPLKSIVMVGHRQQGLKTQVFFQCQMCLYKDSVWTEPHTMEYLDIHRGAIVGCMVAGIGCSQMGEFLAAVDVPTMSEHTYRKYEDCVTQNFIDAASNEMAAAADLEKELAIQRGDVIDGIPHIPVIADGSWMKRSYRSGKYDSLSGVGAIVGYHTQKVLFIGVRNKYCTVCQRAACAGKEPAEHVCYKNWARNKISSSMESDAIVEGFKSSVEGQGLIYSTLIGDGNISVHKKILDSDPYPNLTVQKVECTNHLLRNLCNKMIEISKTKGRFGRLRKVIEGKMLKARTAVKKAMQFRSAEEGSTSMKARKLAGDILNIPSHIFGEHKKCAEIGYFCDGSAKADEENFVPALKNHALYDQIEDLFSRFSRNSPSLILRFDSNAVERYNSIIAKYIGGKRLNYGGRGSYTGRCAAAVLQFNTKKAVTALCGELDKKPAAMVQKLEDRRIKHIEHKNVGKIKIAERRKNVPRNESTDNRLKKM